VTGAHRSRLRRLSLPGALVVFATTLLVGAAPASAHAQLISTSPQQGALLERSPDQVVLTFGEDVQARTDAIEVLTSSGNDLRVGSSHHPPGRADQVAAALPADLHGTYVVTWRVISADTHPVQGAFTFSVGTITSNGSTNGLEHQLLAARKGSRTVGTVAGINRFFTYASVIALLGGGALILIAWPDGLSKRRVRRYLQIAAATMALSALLGIALQGIYGAGKPFHDLLQSSSLSPAVATRFGYASVVRAALALVALIALSAIRTRRLSPWHKVIAGLAGVAVIVTISLSGHGNTGRWQPAGLILDIVHVSAAAMWLGGLALITVFVVGPRKISPASIEEVRPTVLAFSTLAAGALAAVVATGVAQAWRQVGSWNLLTSTSYGHLLMLKTVAVAAAAQAGWFNRQWVRANLTSPVESQRSPPAKVPALAGAPGPVPSQATPPPPFPDQSTGPGLLRRLLILETITAVIILAVTSLLVDAAPPHQTPATAAASAQPFTRTIDDGGYQLAIAVTPAATGTNQINLNLTDQNGTPRNPFQIYAQLNLPARHLGPIDAPLNHTATGHWTATTTLPLAGSWQLYIGLLTSPTNEIDQTLTFTVSDQTQSPLP